MRTNRKTNCPSPGFCTRRILSGERDVLKLKREVVSPKKQNKQLEAAGGDKGYLPSQEFLMHKIGGGEDAHFKKCLEVS